MLKFHIFLLLRLDIQLFIVYHVNENVFIITLLVSVNSAYKTFKGVIKMRKKAKILWVAACLASFVWSTTSIFASANTAPPESGDTTVSEEYGTGRMTYRKNTLNIRSGNNISIIAGTFTVKDFNITPGQDPDGLNYAGQTHELENGQITFDVGRKGSEAVASWFNTQFSGYNDPETNGDRTVFDKTAGKLNFAFVGDLTLEITSLQTGQISVTFSDIAFAQEGTTFSNSWWLGQLEGQHTQDSDGSANMLVFGKTNGEETLYASFSRDKNSANTISLEAVHIPESSNDKATKIANVKETFQALPIYGNLSALNGFPGNYEPVVNHVQGYGQYFTPDNEQYSILTHSASTAPYAHIVAAERSGGKLTGYKTYLKNWRHPGGIQTIGNYLIVPNEQTDQAHVALYDLRSLPVQELRRVESFDLPVSHKAGSVGITSYTDTDQTEYYIMIAAHLDGINSVYHVYRADAANGLENAAFSEVGIFPMEKDFQGFGLITEAETNDIYMIGLWAPNEGATFADYAYLYKIDMQTWTPGEELHRIHMISSGGGVGMLGVHFRYGAGVTAAPDGRLLISATERNTILGGSLATNDWGTPNSR